MKEFTLYYNHQFSQHYYLHIFSLMFHYRNNLNWKINEIISALTIKSAELESSHLSKHLETKFIKLLALFIRI